MRRSPAPALGTAALVLAGLLAAASRGDPVAPAAALDPSLGPARDVDPDGMTHLARSRRRSPSGLLYPYPPEPRRLRPLGDRLRVGGALELGGLVALDDADEARFERYRDWDDPGLVSAFDVSARDLQTGLEGALRGASVGRDDAAYAGEVGLPGRVRLRGFHDAVPLAYATDARPLFQGIGSESLRLPSPLVPGAGGAGDVAAALAGVGPETLALQRERTKLELLAWPSPSLELFARYRLDERDGERPFGGSLVFAAGARPDRVVETVRPVDDRTHRVEAGADLALERVQASLGYAVSLYENRAQTLTFENPFLVAGPGSEVVERGRFALEPDNVFHRVHGDVGLALPLAGRLTAGFAWTRAEQEGDLLPPTVNSGIVGMPGVNAIDLDAWNQTGALGEDVRARVDAWVAHARLELRPWRPLRLGARFRLHERDTETDYTARNPVTGQIGFVAEDGALNAATPFSRVFTPGVPMEDFRFRSIPYDVRKWGVESFARVALPARTALSLRLGREEIRRDHRARRHTREYTARASVASRALGRANLRASYDFSRRTGGGFDPDALDAFFVSSLPGFVPFFGSLRPRELADLRQPDLASRTGHRAQARAHLLLREDCDLALAGHFDERDYDADYGLRSERSAGASVEADLQVSPDLAAFAFGTFEHRARDLAGIDDAPGFGGQDPGAGGDVFPLENAWRLDSRAQTWGAGAGLRWRPHPRVEIESAYHFLLVEERLEYAFAGPGALPRNLDPADAGSRFPTLRQRDHVLEVSARVDLTERLALRLLYRWQRGAIADFHLEGLEPLAVDGALFLGHVERDYEAHLLGATARLSF